MPVSLLRRRPGSLVRDCIIAAAFHVVALSAALGGAAPAPRPEFALAALFTDGAILQADKPVPVWGTANPGDLVAVTFAGQARSALTGRDGRWVAVLDPLPASGAAADLTVADGQQTRVVHNVAVGEVWLCAGPAMGVPVSALPNARDEIASAGAPLVREIRLDRRTAPAPAGEAGTSGWQAVAPTTVARFGAVAYGFARSLQPRLGVPVGVINVSWPGTPIEAWLSPLALRQLPASPAVAARWRDAVAQYPKNHAAFEVRLARWNADDAAAGARGPKVLAVWRRQNPPPRPPAGAPGDPAAPGGLFDGMVNPVVPYAIRGALWFDTGETLSPPADYHALFSALITSWRAHFGQGEFPFYWVNLPAFGGNAPTDVGGALLRQAQTETLALPHTGQAVAIDLAGPPASTAGLPEIGRRLALLAKRGVYDIAADDTGPTFASATREGSALRVRFNDAGNGLIAHDRPPQALEVAGPDHVFHPAQGRIERDTLLVSSPAVRDPVAVRYAWRDNPGANLAGGNGLPVPPFCSEPDSTGPAR